MLFFVGFTIFSFSPQFENIKVAEAQNNEALQSGKRDLKELLKQKQTVDIRIQSVLAMVGTHTVYQTFRTFLLLCYYTVNMQPYLMELLNLWL